MRKRESFTISGNIISEIKEKELSNIHVAAYIAGTKKKVGEAVTDAKGRFKIQFEYIEPVEVLLSLCPHAHDRVLNVTPKITHRISKQAWKEEKAYLATINDLPIVKKMWDLWETICKRYTIFGGVFQGIPDPDNPGDYLDLIPIPDVTVHIHDVDRGLPPFFFDEFSKSEIGTATTGPDGLFLFEFDWCYSLRFCIPFPDAKPDISFTVTQPVNDAAVLIYEDRESQTLWDVDDAPPLGVSLIVEEDVILPDDPITLIDGDFEFHGIGRVLPSQIDSQGYADTSGVGDVVKAKDSPFGSTIDVKGQFNNSLSGKYYQVLFAEWANDSTPPGEEEFTAIQDESWPIAQKVDDVWVTVQKTPVELPGAIHACYLIPDYTDLFTTSKGILIRWRTHRKDSGAARYANGKFSFKVKVFENDGTEVSLPDGGDTEVVVRIDNTRPVAAIEENISIIDGTCPVCPDPKPPGMICDNPEVCGIVYIEDDKKIRFRINAYDNENHFKRYRLSYRYGHGEDETIQTRYYLDPPREDYGFTHEIVDWDITDYQQCGYEVRLRVWDRTTDGYRPIHRKEDTVHLILLEVPAS